jgi:hypothetical protein
MPKRIDFILVVLTIVLGVMYCTKVIQEGATTRAALYSHAQETIAPAFAGKASIATIDIHFGTKNESEERLPDVAPALAGMVSGAPTVHPETKGNVAAVGK